jgi:hypothetical protein
LSQHALSLQHPAGQQSLQHAGHLSQHLSPQHAAAPLVLESESAAMWQPANDRSRQRKNLDVITTTPSRAQLARKYVFHRFNRTTIYAQA